MQFYILAAAKLINFLFNISAWVDMTEEGEEETCECYSTLDIAPSEVNDEQGINQHTQPGIDQLPCYYDAVNPSAPSMDEFDPPPKQIPLEVNTNEDYLYVEPMKSEDVTPLEETEQSIHFKSVMLSILIVAFILVAFLTKQPLWLIGSGIAYFLYIIECFCSSTTKYLSNFHDQETVAGLIQKIRSTAPVINWQVSC